MKLSWGSTNVRVIRQQSLTVKLANQTVCSIGSQRLSFVVVAA